MKTVYSDRLREREFLRLGTRIAALKLPTVCLFEGGYAVVQIGYNVAHVSRGFEDAIPD